MGQKIASIRSKMLLPQFSGLGALMAQVWVFENRKSFLSTPASPLCWCAMAAQKVSGFYRKNLVFGVTTISSAVDILGFTIVLIVLQFGVMGLKCQPFVSYWLRSLWNLWKTPVLIWGQKGCAGLKKCARRHAKTT